MAWYNLDRGVKALQSYYSKDEDQWPSLPFSAKNAKVRVGANTLTAKQWTATPEADELDTTNFEGSGFYECIMGIKKLTVTIDFDVDSAQNHFDTLGFTAGATVSTVKLYWQNTAGPYWDIPTARVKTAPNPMNVKEAGKASVTLICSGTFTSPTGTFTPA